MMETAQSFKARRSAASNLPQFQLPPPDHLSQINKYPAYAPSTTQPAPAVVNSVLTPPAGLQSNRSPLGAASVSSQGSGSSPFTSSSSSASSHFSNSSTTSSTSSSSSFSTYLTSSSAGVPPYQPMGYWPVSRPAPNYHSNTHIQPPPKGEGLPPPPYDISLPPFSPSAEPDPSNSVPEGCPRPSHGGYNLPAMADPIMSNVHSLGNQMALVGGMSMPYPPYQMRAPMYGQQENNRPFKCDQCPQTFNRNHDLKRHKRIHLALKPYPCGHCEKSFFRKDALKRHILVKGCGKLKNEATSTNDASSPGPPLNDDSELELSPARNRREQDRERQTLQEERRKQLQARLEQKDKILELEGDTKESPVLERIWLGILSSAPGQRLPDVGKARMKLTFQVSWDLSRFMRDQFGDPDSHMPSIGSVIVLSGTALNAQATTCKDYLQQHWPDTYQSLLNFLEDVLKGRLTTIKEDDLELLGWMEGGKKQNMTIDTEGDPEKIVQIAQQLAWLGAALQHSSGPGLMYSEAIFSTFQGVKSVFDITFRQSPLKEDEQSCWFSLFTSSVIAKDFPIAARGQEVGLEIPLEMMAALTGVRHAVEYEGGILLKGYSSVFLPVKRYKDSIQWHYIENEENVRLPYWAVKARCPGRAMLEEVSMDSLKNTRAFVGWWGTTETHLGTSTANYENIDWSAADQVGRSMTFSGGTLGFQQIMTGEVNFSLGARDGKLHVERKGPYQTIVQCAARSPVVLYDACEKRAWLVPSSGVILHIARTRNHMNPYMIDGKEILFPAADPSISNHEAAEKVLLSQASCKLCASDDLGNKDYCLGDLVRDIWSYLESLLDKNVTKEATSDPEVRGTMRHLLRGWEFMDLVYDRSPFRLKETYIEKSSGSWTNLARDIDAIVLFGSGFEDIIKPSEQSTTGLCHAWKSVPRGKDYMTASVPMMNWLYTVAGSKLTRKHLTSTHLRWHKGGQLWERCQSTKPYSCSCSRLQQVVSDNFAQLGGVADPGPLEEKGAVIFGQASGPLASTVLDLLRPKVQQSGSLYSQPNVDLLNTDTFSSPGSSLSSDAGTSSTSNVSISTFPTSDDDDQDPKVEDSCGSQYFDSVKLIENDKKRRRSQSRERNQLEESAKSVQHPYRRQRKRCSEDIREIGGHSERAHALAPFETPKEGLGPSSIEKITGEGQNLSLRRKGNFIRQLESKDGGNHRSGNALAARNG